MMFDIRDAAALLYHDMDAADDTSTGQYAIIYMVDTSVFIGDLKNYLK